MQAAKRGAVVVVPAGAKAVAKTVAPPSSLIDDVTRVVTQASPFPPDSLTACMDLRQVLGLTDEIKRGLSNSLQLIARQFDAKARIADDECAKLEVFEDVVKLVAKKAGFTFETVCG